MPTISFFVFLDNPNNHTNIKTVMVEVRVTSISRRNDSGIMFFTYKLAIIAGIDNIMHRK